MVYLIRNILQSLVHGPPDSELTGRHVDSWVQLQVNKSLGKETKRLLSKLFCTRQVSEQPGGGAILLCQLPFCVSYSADPTACHTLT